jgi:glycosyltransferase involved in cell wall biosynthesis
MTSRWLLTAGDFRRHGGMDVANHALAAFLARQSDAEIHLVAHSVSSELASLPSVTVHRAPRPFDSHRLGQPFLRSVAHRVKRRLRTVRCIANGGNADLCDVNWVHYVHGAFEPRTATRRALGLAGHRKNVRQERVSLTRARTIICNSRRTADDVVRLEGVDAACVRVVYYGIDPIRFGPISAVERERTRRRLALGDKRAVALFVGALGDRRKNFDTLFDAWRRLCAMPDWDADLVVAGDGAEFACWKALSAAHVPHGRIRFLGYQEDVASLIGGCDVLVHPSRYEPYGLAVHEALCRGIPTIASSKAGIAERYPDDLRPMLLDDAESAAELARRLLAWRSNVAAHARSARTFGAWLRQRTWDDMARDFVSETEAT